MLIQITVKTNQKESKLWQDPENSLAYVASLKALPVENKANAELIGLVAKYFNVTKAQVSVKTGQKSKQKRVHIDENN